jgi:nucleotide-binding universal stress UspA family protein
MLRSVVAGVDGSAESLAAADWAAREARRRGVPLRLLHAWQRQPHPSPSLPDGANQRHWAERILRHAEADLRRRHPDLDLGTEQVPDSPADALMAAAEEAELLVLGNRGLSGVGGFLVGSVALASVARAQRPVVLVRAGEVAEDEHLPDRAGNPSVRTPHRKVVLGLNLRHPCDELLAFAFDAAAHRGAPLQVVYAWHPPSACGYASGDLEPGDEAEWERQEMRTLSALLHRWQEKFPGTEVEETLASGRAAQHLLRASSGAGLLVVGRRMRQAPAGARTGPVTHAVIHHVSCPVAVVPHD